MLNSKQERELAYVVLIDKIEPIIGSDNCESAIVNGWHIMVRKEQFKPGDPAIYFEIDSRVPADRECFSFLEKRNYKVKTQKFTFGGKGNFISQGLLMHATDFGWNWYIDEGKNIPYIYNNQTEERYYPDDESRFLTKQLGVTYADEEDNQRKAPTVDKYKKMAGRHPKIFKKPFVRWMMKYNWGRKLLFFFFGKKKDKKNGWPVWVQKTDEERIECMPFILQSKNPWIVTEKVDGSSSTFTMKRGKFGKKDFYVCSRNVCFDSIDKPCYYDTNIYWEMAQKYKMYDILSQLLDTMPAAEWITIQGETYGESVQRNTYDLSGRDFKAFNLVTSDKGRWNSCDMKELLEDKYGIPCVPILDKAFILPDTIEELRTYVDSKPSIINGKMKEGIVCRSPDGIHSFKCVSPEYLLKYHS
jgi:hypothetical protein